MSNSELASALSVPQVAKLLGVGRGMIYHWISQGRIKVLRMHPILVAREDAVIPLWTESNPRNMGGRPRKS